VCFVYTRGLLSVLARGGAGGEVKAKPTPSGSEFQAVPYIVQ
jgi:hypothetical protein